MAVTYYVTLPFIRTEDGTAPGEAQERQSESAAIRRPEGMSRDAANAGAVAFKRAGDPNVGEFSDAVVLKKFGDVPEDLSGLRPRSCCCAMAGMAAAGYVLSSPDPCRLVNFLGFAGFAVYFLANDFLRDLGEIGHQGGIQLLEFRPQRLLDKAFGSFDHDGLTVHPRMAEWSHAVAPAQCDEQLPGPDIRNRELPLDEVFLVGGLAETLADTFCSRARGSLLAGRSRASEESFDLA